MHLNGQYSDNMEIITNNFKSVFASAYSSSTSINPHTIPFSSDPVELSSCHISVAEVFNGVSLLKPDIKSGPDLVPSILLLNCKNALTRPIHFLFSLSLSMGRFPSCWKLSYIFPIFKLGNRDDIQNYRPMSKLNVLSKLFEKLHEPKITSSLNIVLSNT